MMRAMGILTGILLTLGLYLLYPADRPTPESLLPTKPPSNPEPHITQSTPPPATNPDTDGTGQVASLKSPPATIPTSNPATYTAVFWQPFNSHYSAEGFAERMQLATGIKVRPVKIDDSNYKVAFDYLDETDRLAKFSIIRNITGLDIVGEAIP